MKISESWLREWVNPDVSTAQLAQQLTMAGLEVDSVTPAAGEFSDVVVGEVIKLSPHPDADKLRVCEVHVGDDEPLQIVCGAANVHEGMKAPTALIGAVLPGNFKIKKSKLRGVESFGMLCSEKELGLAESAEGLMSLPADAPVGKDIRAYLQLDDQIIEVDLTPNRGDCLGMAGIAREVGVLNRLQVTNPAVEPIKAQTTARFPVTITASKDCPRYLGRVIEGIDATATTPLWMQEKLRRAGVRSISPVVDVTNFVLMELGQPMHAFDLDKIEQGIEVRRAKKGEQLTLLDGKSVSLDDEVLVIADGNGPVALAGVMGGESTAVGAQTRNLFLECAFFSPLAIAGRARRFGMQTDSSYRFERGVDPERCEEAMERATALLLELVGGQAGPIVDVSAEDHQPQTTPIVLRRARLAKVLGITLPDDEVKRILSLLGMQVSDHNQGWQVVAPRFRFDIEAEIDLIEEVGRIYGYDRLPSRHQGGQGRLVLQPETTLSQTRLQQSLVDRGYQEIITYSFIDPQWQALFEPGKEAVTLANPISSEMAVMRRSLIPGLIQTLIYNRNRQQGSQRLFECGLNFVIQDTEIKQEKYISAACIGDKLPEQWGVKTEALDFYDIKADLEALFRLTNRPDEFIFTEGKHSALHPGQTACVVSVGKDHKKNIGWIGAIHPRILQKQGINDNIYVFEVSLEGLTAARLPQYQALSKYPSIRRDLAVVVDEQVNAAEIEATIRETLPDLVQEITIFDVYRGPGVDSGRKSLALGLILQESSRTLTDKEIAAAVDKIVVGLEKQYQATLRE